MGGKGKAAQWSLLLTPMSILVVRMLVDQVNHIVSMLLKVVSKSKI
jgi:hypothetical protein